MCLWERVGWREQQRWPQNTPPICCCARVCNKMGLKYFWSRAQPDWVYEFPDRTGRDIQICRTGPAGPNRIWTYTFKHFNYQVWDMNSHKIRSDTSLVSKVNKKNKNLDFLFPGRKMSGFGTLWILKICQTSGLDVMSGRAWFWSCICDQTYTNLWKCYVWIMSC